MLTSVKLLLAIAALAVAGAPAIGQSVTPTSIDEIPNDSQNVEPFAGGVRVTHRVETQSSNNLRDIHICVAETEIDRAPGAMRRTVKGDPVNDNYRETPGRNIPNWSYRGIRAASTVTVGQTTTTRWCLTWTRSPDAEDPGTNLDFRFDYKGRGQVGLSAGQIVFLTTDGDTTLGPADSGVGGITVQTAAAGVQDDQTATADTQREAHTFGWKFALIILGIIILLWPIFYFLVGRGNPPTLPPETEDAKDSSNKG